jgi:hypothetical protein
VDTRWLLISNPPHGSVDAAQAASHFGLAAAEVGMKANYGLPEIWFTTDDEASLQDTAAALDAAGLKTVLVAGSDLVAIPPQSPAESFVFTDEGLQLDGDGSGWTLAYDAPLVAVFGRPRVEAQEARAPASSVASQLSSWGKGFRRPGGDAGGPVELGASPFLDLYVSSEAGPRRISIVPEVTDFSRLPDDHPHGLSAMQNLVAECESRFENAYVDRRLVDMTLRGIARVVTGNPDLDPPRRGFSYATQALEDLLASLSPDLKDVAQPDLSSRLAYLTNRSLTS